jgi:sporulation protein YlmC with PRC-barrel domain
MRSSLAGGGVHMKGMVFARTLQGKRVIDTGGGSLGVVDDLRVEDTIGIVTALVVKPKRTLSELGKRRDCSAIPFDAVKAVKDLIVVNRESLKVVNESYADLEESSDYLEITDNQRVNLSKAGRRYEML